MYAFPPLAQAFSRWEGDSVWLGAGERVWGHINSHSCPPRPQRGGGAERKFIRDTREALVERLARLFDRLQGVRPPSCGTPQTGLLGFYAENVDVQSLRIIQSGRLYFE